jgi:hypothetical protein
MRLSGIAVAVSCLLVSSPSLAQNETPSPMPLEEREAREAVSKALKGLAEAYGEIYETKQSQCMRAIGIVSSAIASHCKAPRALISSSTFASCQPPRLISTTTHFPLKTKS